MPKVIMIVEDLINKGAEALKSAEEHKVNTDKETQVILENDIIQLGEAILRASVASESTIEISKQQHDILQKLLMIKENKTLFDSIIPSDYQQKLWISIEAQNTYDPENQKVVVDQLESLKKQHDNLYKEMFSDPYKQFSEAFDSWSEICKSANDMGDIANSVNKIKVKHEQVQQEQKEIEALKQEHDSLYKGQPDQAKKSWESINHKNINNIDHIKDSIGKIKEVTLGK